MKTAQIFAAPTIAEVTEINTRNIKQALKDYVKHTDTQGVISEISDAFIDRLAYDSAANDSAANKSGLRKIFRNVKGWVEDLQAIIINGTSTHDPDWEVIWKLTHDITAGYREGILAKAESTGDFCDFYDFKNAMHVFQHKDGRICGGFVNALKKFVPHAYRSNRPLHKIFQDFCKVIGVYDSKAGSEFQNLYAQYADEMRGRKLNFKLFVSINPAHFLTMSNPINDKRNKIDPATGLPKPMLVSCHSLNRSDYTYHAGNSGYARDEVTFVVFTVANPDNAELLNNRKTTRQLFMYEPNNGLLLQSRLYNTSGGTNGAQVTGDLYRDLVQRAISEGEGAVNMWKTKNFDASGIDLPPHYAFQGYCDWLKYNGNTIKVSIRNDKADSYKNFTIGTYSLCVNCGEEIIDVEDDKPTHYCPYCDNRARCDECGRFIDEDDVTWVINEGGNEIAVCEDCLNEYYFYCPHCCEWHHYNDGTQLANEDWVCNDCLSDHCYQCEMCGEWFPNDYDVNYAFDHGSEVCVCDSCLDYYFTQCEACGDYFRDDEICNGFCRECFSEQEQEEDESA